MENETLGTLKAYMQLVDQLVEHATKEQLSECARILALNVAHYASRYGELSLEERLDFLQATDLSEEQAKLVQHGLEVFRWRARERAGTRGAKALSSLRVSLKAVKNSHRILDIS